MKLAITCLLACLAANLSAGDPPMQRMQITLERRDAAKWKAVEPGLVFTHQDKVRFRFRANFSGYLYVMNHATSGQYVQLFPSSQAGMANRVEPDQEYVVPATDGAFRVSGPAGYDVVYWMVSAVELNPSTAPSASMLPPPPPVRSSPLPTLLPRCNDGMLRARGECVDTAGGARDLASEQPAPPNLQAMQQAPSRELIFIREKESTVVSAPGPMQGPVIYEFRIAHK